MKSKAVLLTLLLIALFTSVAVLPALAHEGECHATVSLYNGWARASVAGAPNSAAYGLLINLTDEDDTLVSASTDAATSVELHEMSMTAEGVMQMRPVEGGFPVAAHNFFTLQPGGFHIMLMGLTRELTPGSMLDLTLVFEHAGEVALSVPVQDPDAMPGMDMGGMSMGDATAEPMHDMGHMDEATAEPMAMDATEEAGHDHAEADAPCGVSIVDAWARPSIAGAPNSAAYMVIANPDPVHEALIGVATDVASMVEIHEMSMTADGVMQMRPVEGQHLHIPEGGAVQLMPGGYHIMLMGLTRELVVGESFTLTLTFEHYGEVSVDVVVRDPDAEGMGGMNMGGG